MSADDEAQDQDARDAPAEHRSGSWRQREDVVTIAVLTTVCAIGVAWGTATAAVAQKLDRTEFEAHASETIRRRAVDSIRVAYQEATLRRIESKQDSTNYRLSRLICDQQPSYCR